MGTITTTDGTEIFYKDWGSGQPIVFSHGWPLSGSATDRAVWGPLGHDSHFRYVQNAARASLPRRQPNRGHACGVSPLIPPVARRDDRLEGAGRFGRDPSCTSIPVASEICSHAWRAQRDGAPRPTRGCPAARRRPGRPAGRRRCAGSRAPSCRDRSRPSWSPGASRHGGTSCHARGMHGRRHTHHAHHEHRQRRQTHPPCPHPAPSIPSASRSYVNGPREPVRGAGEAAALACPASELPPMSPLTIG